MTPSRPPLSLTVNEKKYKSRNPLARYLVRRFFDRVSVIVASLAPDSILEVGSGEGVLLWHLEGMLPPHRTAALDLDVGCIRAARANVPAAALSVGDACALPVSDHAFDLIICSEVLEHVATPDRALKELARVTSRYVLLSVPRTPIWNFLNMARGAYLRRLGNTPGHLNQWTSGQFLQYVRPYFFDVRLASSIPWTIALCRKDARHFASLL